MKQQGTYTISIERHCYINNIDNHCLFGKRGERKHKNGAYFYGSHIVCYKDRLNKKELKKATDFINELRRVRKTKKSNRVLGNQGGVGK